MTPFDLIDAGSAADAVALLQAHPAAQAIASGGDLLGLLKEGVSGPALPTPGILVNLATAPDLHGIDRTADGLRLGAMATLDDLARHPEIPPALRRAVGGIASPQLRARTTIGGNLLQRPRCWYFRHPEIPCFKKGGTGCPAIGGPAEAYPGALLPGLCHAGHPSDLAPPLIALGAEADLIGPKGPRRVPLVDLYAGAESRAGPEAQLRPAEILAALRVPHPDRALGFEKIAPRDANEFAWASAAVALQLDGGVIVAARIALGGISPAPLLWSDPKAIVGRPVDAAAADALVRDILAGSRLALRFPARFAACATAVRRAIAGIDAIPRS